MNWQIQQILRRRRGAETGAIPAGCGGALSVCLVYPNHYAVAMSSLGFQTVYKLFNDQPDLVCERAFLPDRDELDAYLKSGDTLVSLENERPLSDFDLVAFSISFEPDFVNIPRILKLARIPSCAADRTGADPLVIAGGAAFLINPEPAAEFFDLIAFGEGEALIPPLAALCVQHVAASREMLLQELGRLAGSYLPAAGHGTAVQRITAPAAAPPACSVLLTDETEFGNMFLVEVSRGCPRGCRFCAAGFVYQPFRQQPLELLKAAVLEGLQHRKTIGLVGAAVSDHRSIEALCNFIVEQGGSPSLSSLRVDRLTPHMLELLAKSGHRTISLAPEGGSQRMRDLIRKNLTADQILDAAEAVARAGILNLRLYFIIGLPGENDQDLEELVKLTAAIKERVVEQARRHKRLGEITLSVNPFIPKPFTPLQWAGMCPLEELKRKVAWLEKRIRPLANLRLKVEDLHGCVLQALLSRGGRELTPLLLQMAEGLNLRKAAKLCGIDVEACVTRTYAPDEKLVWEVAPVADRERLLTEYQAAMKQLPEEQTP
ncbi:radical SAM protein [Trichlorobacter lovleyi]|uniref:radical SAM protein n=1 Tax=Trichlorobacter lovleyi TaxID=313985 RepID=UPI002480996E|nr:radical SAM protein [Trichlorobacter lovleyi]